MPAVRARSIRSIRCPARSSAMRRTCRATATAPSSTRCSWKTGWHWVSAGRRRACALEDLQQHRVARGHGVCAAPAAEPVRAVFAGSGPGQRPADDQPGQRGVRPGQGPAVRGGHEAGLRRWRVDAGRLPHPQDRSAQPRPAAA
ncbi:hypothetical protein G6F61_014454 [Rhizopus arrhizus]|nr:hypothetical protein G6F61_014454 [Rhizopus arrhizus]